MNTTTVLLILYVLNARNDRHSHLKSVYIIACPQETKKKMTPWQLMFTESPIHTDSDSGFVLN